MSLIAAHPVWIFGTTSLLLAFLAGIAIGRYAGDVKRAAVFASLALCLVAAAFVGAANFFAVERRTIVGVIMVIAVLLPVAVMMMVAGTSVGRTLRPPSRDVPPDGKPGSDPE
jgi:peptidoglycan/LPS O-acetylase OafA/YrhL